MKLFAHMVLFVLALPAYGSAYFVAPDGRDMNPGTMEKPFATLRRAQEALRQKRGEVFLRGGTYHLSAPLVFNAEDSGMKESPVIFQAYQNEQPVISGGVKLGKLDDYYKDDITGRPLWLKVKSRRFGHSFFVALRGAKPSGDNVVVAFEKNVIKQAPLADHNGPLTTDEDAQLERYYGTAT